MSGSINDKEEANRSTTAQVPVSVEVEDAMHSKRFKICPRKVLESLSHPRIDGARIKPIEGQSPKAGGTAEVEAAILASAQESDFSESDEEEYVAVKKMRFDEDTDVDRTLAPLAHEISLLNNLTHENVVEILGFVENVEQGVAWMVFAWERNGNLREFIRSAKWELPERVSLIDDVAGGLNYLHGRNPPICHGDLKSLNILVNRKNLAVITDFGSARAVDSVANEVLKGVHPATATPTPQLAATRAQEAESPTVEIAPSGESITMTGPGWTAVTGNFPFENEDNVGAIVRITKGDLPQVENDDQLRQIKALCSLMKECWKLDTCERPTAVKCQRAVSFMDQTIPSRGETGSSSVTRSSGLLYALGRMEIRKNAYNKAQEYFKQSLSVAESVGDEWRKAKAEKAIGDMHGMRNEYSKAEESYIKAREICSQIGDQKGFAESVSGLGDVYQIRNEYSKAEESYIRARNIDSQIGDRPGFAQSVRSLGDVYRMRNEYSKAEESFIQARDIYSQIGDQLGFAQSVHSLGEVYYMRDEYSKAEELFIQARDIYSQLGDQKGLAQSVRSLGDVYRMRKEYSKAKESLGDVYLMRDEYSNAEESFIPARDIYFQIGHQLGFTQSVHTEESYIQARDIYSQIGDQLGLSQSVRSLGDLYQMREEYSKAEKSCIQARDIYSEIGDQLGFAQSVQGLGDVYQIRKEYSEAEELYIQARDIYSQMEDQVGFAQSLRGLGEVYRLRNEYSKAEESFIQARDIHSQIGYQLGLAQAFEGMGHVQAAREEYARAEASYSEAEQIYHRTGDAYSSATILWYRGLLHHDRGQYREAECLVIEASTIYGRLGLQDDVDECDEFLEDIRPLIE
ncbi:hypothetical protein M407DRAFT_29652 [Tulasnella calospora MUT 4182]|uniref:Protein kinase domain-containing protein n=1 Tax=Tulasnella calospora MUT 4182 TaxID=1051891 RepID=A0A0C3Q8M6_9AGAM|nr:hypothetical protein M407DRAFT_29652 [Tulasnella calospora MUT 4182]